MAHNLTSVVGSEVDQVLIRRALLSVSDKTGLIDLARSLTSYGVELLSTGGTAKALRDAGFTVQDVSDYTGSPEILDGRVKTLHPKVHGGLLGVRGNPKHEREMQENGINNIDLVVMNLYPFEATVASGASFENCIENIDIGGPSMLRSAAKNHRYVSVLCDPQQYSFFIDELQRTQGSISLSSRKRLAAKAFATSAQYDTAIATYFAQQDVSSSTATSTSPPLNNSTALTPSSTSAMVPSTITRVYQPVFSLKYGCNPHQTPAHIYAPLGSSLPFTVRNGTPGYINLLDALNAWQLVKELRTTMQDTPAAASFKHVSPAGVGLGLVPLSAAEAQAYEIQDPTSLSPVALAYIRARNADPLSSFGDFVAVSHVVDVATALVLKHEVSDGIIAPGFEPEALTILSAKKKGAFIVLEANDAFQPPKEEYREVYGTVFAQGRNDVVFSRDTHLQNVVVGGALSEDAIRDLILASITVKYTQSNSIAYATRGQVIGVGAGQQSRVDCVKLAARKVHTWYLRQHPKVQALSFQPTVKRQERVNARVRYIEGDLTPAELPGFQALFTTPPEPLQEDIEDVRRFVAGLSQVALASDAFFPFRDSIDHASKAGVTYIAQPGGSVADEEVKRACAEYGMTMAFTNLRLFHH